MTSSNVRDFQAVREHDAASASAVTGVQEFQLDIESEIAPDSFSRILATLVNGSPVYLAGVTVGAEHVYPTDSGPLVDPTASRTCRFRVRHAGSHLSDNDVEAIVARVGARFSSTASAAPGAVVGQSLLAS